MMKKPVLIPFLIAALVSVCLAAEEHIVISTDQPLEGDEKTEVYTIHGPVEVRYKDISIKASGMTYWQKEKKARLKGPLSLVSREVAITSRELEYLFQEEKGVFMDQVIMEVKSREKQGKKREPFVMNCNELFFSAKTRDFQANKGARIIHTDFSAYAREASYAEHTQELTLKTRASLTRSKKEKVLGNVIIIHLKDKSFEVQGAVKLEFIVEKEKNPKKEKKAG
ncbi:MAG: LptA/OstA family protein [Bacillota bacterium]